MRATKYVFVRSHIPQEEESLECPSSEIHTSISQAHVLLDDLVIKQNPTALCPVTASNYQWHKQGVGYLRPLFISPQICVY